MREDALARKRKRGHREPNGRLSRRREHVAQRQTEIEREARSVVIDARMRIFGMTREQAEMSTAGFALGRALDATSRLARGRQITPHQMAAADAYYDDYRLYRRHVLGVHVPGDRMPPMPDSVDSYDETTERAKRRWHAAQEAVERACQEMGTRLPAMALENIVIRDIDMPRLYGDLRVALNHLVRHYLIGKRRAA